jgi:hypothetical protein
MSTNPSGVANKGSNHYGDYNSAGNSLSGSPNPRRSYGESKEQQLRFSVESNEGAGGEGIIHLP